MNKTFGLLLINAFLILTQMSVVAQDKRETVEVPMKFRGSMPAIEVLVNDRGPFLFAIDTGGQGQARADTTLVEKLKLKTVGEVLASDGSGRNARSLNVVKINSIRIGDLEFKDVRALTRDYNRSPRIPPIDGILGFNLFADHLLTLDYPRRIVRIEKGELPAANGRDILDFEAPNGVPVIELKIGKDTVKAHIDSGNMVSGFVLPTELVEKLPQIGEPKTVGQARTISNTIEIKQVRLKDTIRLGKFEFSQPLVVFPALREANVGSPLWQEFSLVFDQKNKRVRLNRTEVKDAPPTTADPKFKEYVGKYGIRTIFEKDGRLYLQREGGPELKLEQSGKDSFALEIAPAAKIEFVRNDTGRIIAVRVLNPRGEWETSTKDDL